MKKFVFLLIISVFGSSFLSITAQAAEFCSFQIIQDRGLGFSANTKIEQFECTTEKPIALEVGYNFENTLATGAINSISKQMAQAGWDLVSVTSAMPIGSFLLVFTQREFRGE